MNNHGEMSDYKERADKRHKQLIDLADEVLVLNVGGYVGDSTAREIFHAKRMGKPIKWLEPRCLCRKCGTPVDYIDGGAVLVCFSCLDAFLMGIGEQNAEAER